MNRTILRHMSDSVSSSKLCTLTIPCFQTITQLGLTFTNNGAASTLANIISSVNTITVLVNGEQILNISAGNLAKVWQSLGPQVGMSTLVNSLPLFIGQLIYKLPAAEDTFALGCDRYVDGNKIDNIQVQVQFGTVTGITQVQAFSERIEQGSGKNITVASMKVLSYFQGFTTTGTSEIDSLPKDSNMARLFTLAIPDATGVISSGECLVNNMPVIQEADQATNNMFIAERGFGPVSGVFNYSFTDGGTYSLLTLAGVDDMRYKTTFSTAPTTGYWLVDCTARSAA